MNLGLNNKIALVTGASSGIGAATAQLLAEEGADIIVCYNRNSEGAKNTSQRVTDKGRRFWLCQMNMSHPDEVASAITKLRIEINRIDIMVLCSGRNLITSLDELTPEEWTNLITINLNGPFYLLREVLPLLGEKASVVTVASVAGHTGAPHHAHYAAAKAGLINLTKSAARALAPRVRVNCVAPGLTLTEMGKETIDNLPPGYEQTKLLTQRFADPDEIARCIVFLASPAASFVTGATLDVNGGRELR